jgi:hypothetical protein
MQCVEEKSQPDPNQRLIAVCATHSLRMPWSSRARIVRDKVAVEGEGLFCLAERFLEQDDVEQRTLPKQVFARDRPDQEQSIPLFWR